MTPMTEAQVEEHADLLLNMWGNAMLMGWMSALATLLTPNGAAETSEVVRDRLHVEGSKFVRNAIHDPITRESIVAMIRAAALARPELAPAPGSIRVHRYGGA